MSKFSKQELIKNLVTKILERSELIKKEISSVSGRELKKSIKDKTLKLMGNRKSRSESKNKLTQKH
jgi:hypothetical protein